MGKKFKIIGIQVFAIMLLAHSSNAQFLHKDALFVGGDIGVQKNIFFISPSIMQYWKIKNRTSKFSVAFGLRSTHVFGNKNLLYITAPAILTSGKKDPSVFFADQIVENIDTVQIQRTQINAVNISSAIAYNFYKKWTLQFAIDLAGISFGTKQNGNLQYNDDKMIDVKAKPHAYNILLISDNDIGTLNSDLSLSFQYKPKISLHTGLAFLFNEYDISPAPIYINAAGLEISNERFRNKNLSFAFGIKYLLK